jgi:hypothetical protein
MVLSGSEKEKAPANGAFFGISNLFLSIKGGSGLA